jgi:hypothetical protein
VLFRTKPAKRVLFKVCRYRLLAVTRVLLATWVKAEPAALLASAELFGLLSTRAADVAALLEVVSLRDEGFVVAIKGS